MLIDNTILKFYMNLLRNSKEKIVFYKKIWIKKAGWSKPQCRGLKAMTLDYFDYFDDYYRYDLARETISIFNKVGLKENEIINLLLNKCIKTNLFHIITRKDSDIKKCLNYSNETNYLEYWNKSIYYCIQLLKITKPKFVIFEWKQVYIADIVEC